MQKRRLPPGRADSCNWWCGGLISSGTYAMLGEVFGSVAGLVNSSGALATQYRIRGLWYDHDERSIEHQSIPVPRTRARSIRPVRTAGALLQSNHGAVYIAGPDRLRQRPGQRLSYSFNAPTDYFDPLGLQGCGSGGGIQCNECNNWLGACYAGGGACKVGHASGHKAPPIHLKFPVPTSPAPSPGQPTLPAAGADSISRKSWARSWPKRAQSSSRQCSADRG